VRTERALSAQLEHLRPQGGEAAPLAWERRRGGVEPIQKCPHRRQRLGVQAGGLGVADPDAHQHAVRELTAQLLELARHPLRLAAPHVEDARGDDDPLGRLEQRPQSGDLGRAAQPESAEAQLLDQPGGRAGVLLADCAGCGPYSEFGELHLSHSLAAPPGVSSRP
jgi:hypothetical protein